MKMKSHISVGEIDILDYIYRAPLKQRMFVPTQRTISLKVRRRRMLAANVHTSIEHTVAVLRNMLWLASNDWYARKERNLYERN